MYARCMYVLLHSLPLVLGSEVAVLEVEVEVMMDDDDS